MKFHHEIDTIGGSKGGDIRYFCDVDSMSENEIGGY
jgi:hypothetical protein